MSRVLFLFMMFSVVGWLWETPWVSFNQKKYVNRGFLRGPYIPIYGTAIVTIIVTMGIFERMNQNNPFVILLELVYMAFITATWEFLTSWILEKLFKTRWWDYSDHRFNIEGRVSLYVTVFFGLGGYTLYRFVLPLFDNLYALVTINHLVVILGCFYVIFVVDSFVTLIDLFKTKNLIDKIEQLSKDLSGKLEIRFEKGKNNYRSSKKEFSDYLTELSVTLKEKYENLPSKKLSNSIKEELKKLNKQIHTSRRLNRFYRKYPNSSSVQLFRVKKFLESLPKIKK